MKTYAWMAFAAICIMSVMWIGVQYNCMNLYAAPVVDELGISRTQFMVVLSIPAVISATVSLLCFGIIEERLGLRRMLLIGGILNTLAFVCWFVMDSVAFLYLGGALYGCGCSITAYNSVAAGVNRWFKKRMGSLMGAANALGNVAGIVSAMVIAVLIATVGWRFSFGCCIVLSAVATIACVALYKGNPGDLGVPAMYEDEAEVEGEAGDSVAVFEGPPFRDAVRRPRMWVLAFGYLLLSTTTYGLMSTLPPFAVDLGLGDSQGPVVSASLFAAALMMVPLGGICDRWGTKWAVLLCCVLAALSALLLRFDSLPFVGLMVSAVCAGAAYSACGVCVGTGVKETFGELEFSKKLGLCSGFSYIGLAVGPAVMNLARDMTGTYTFVLLVFAVLAAITALIFFATTSAAGGTGFQSGKAIEDI